MNYAYASDKKFVPCEERMKGPFQSYEVDEALNTLDKAIKIRKNAALMSAVRKKAKEKLTAAQATANRIHGEK